MCHWRPFQCSIPSGAVPSPPPPTHTSLADRAALAVPMNGNDPCVQALPLKCAKYPGGPDQDGAPNAHSCVGEGATAVSIAASSRTGAAHPFPVRCSASVAATSSVPRAASTQAFVPEVAATAATPWSSGLSMYALGGVTARHARPSQCRTTTVPLPASALPHVAGSAHSSPASQASCGPPAHSPPIVTPASTCEIRQPAGLACFAAVATGAAAAADAAGTEPTTAAQTASGTTHRASRRTVDQPADSQVRSPIADTILGTRINHSELPHKR
jgi:hypothetical protein